MEFFCTNVKINHLIFIFQLKNFFDINYPNSSPESLKRVNIILHFKKCTIFIHEFIKQNQKLSTEFSFLL